jgi:hypothetical protein
LFSKTNILKKAWIAIIAAMLIFAASAALANRVQVMVPGTPVYGTQGAQGHIQTTTFPDATNITFNGTTEEWEAMDSIDQRQVLDDCNRAAGGGCIVWEERPNGSGQYLTDDIERGSYAETLFRYAMGTEGNTCISCDLLAYFMVGMTKFSESVFTYFLGFFKVVVPVMVAIWIGYRVAKLAVAGGEDGREFIKSIVQKLSLFVMVWLITTATLGGQHPGQASTNERAFLWETVGPTYLYYAFKLSGEIRNQSIAAASSSSSRMGDLGRDGATPFNCTAPQTSTGPITDMISGVSVNYIQQAMEIGCVTERTHMIGIASGVAIMFTSYNGAASDSGVQSFSSWLIFGLVKVFCGAMLMAVFIMSCVWLVFLTLDVVTRGLVTAAFAPVIMGLFLWKPTRDIAVNAIKGMGGAMITAIAITIVSVLAYFLIVNTVDVYNALVPLLQSTYPDMTIDRLDGDRNSQFARFISRIQESDRTRPAIPMNLSTPYFFYMCLSGIAIFSLGKKIVAMLSGLVGAQGFSAFADNALSMGRTGAIGGMAGAGIGLVALKTTGGLLAGPAGFLGKAAGGAAVGGVAAGGNMLQNMMSPGKNPFSAISNVRRGAEATMNGAMDDTSSTDQ